MTLKRMNLKFASQYAGCDKGKNALDTFGYGSFLSDDLELFNFKRIKVIFKIRYNSGKAQMILNPRLPRRIRDKSPEYFKTIRYTNSNMCRLERRRFIKALREKS